TSETCRPAAACLHHPLKEFLALVLSIAPQADTPAATVMLGQSQRSLSVEAAVSAAFDGVAVTLSSPNTQRQCCAGETKRFAYAPMRRNVNVVSGLITSPFISSNG